LSIVSPYFVDKVNEPFSTSIEIIPEWYFTSTFNILRVLPAKFIGVLSMIYFPAVLLILISSLENLNVFQNPFRRSHDIIQLLSVLVIGFLLSIGSFKLISASVLFL